MSCPIKPDKQRAFYAKVYKDLTEIQKADKSFNLKDYIQSIFDLVQSKDPEQAPIYAQITPSAIRDMTTGDLTDYLTDNGLDLNELNVLSKSFRKDIVNVAEYIAPVSNIKEEIELDKKAKFLETKAQSEVVKKPELELTPSSIFTTTGQQAKFRSLTRIMKEDDVSEDKARDIQDTEKKQNIPESRMDYYYSFIKHTLNNLRKVGKVHLTAMSATNIAKGDLNSHDEEFLNYGTEADKKAATEDFDKSTVMVVTDSTGKPLRFNKDFVPEKSGKIVYYPIKRIHRDKKGNLIYKKSGVQTPEELSKTSKGALSVEAAADLLNKQAKEIENISKYVQESKDNKVIGYITGGSKGYVPFDKNTDTDLSVVVFDKGFEVIIPKTKKKANDAFISVPDINVNIPIRGRYLTQSNAEKLAVILVDDINLGSDPITNSDRFRIFASWLPFREADVLYFPSKNLIRIEGIILDTSDKTAAKEKIVKFLMAPRIMTGSKPVEKKNRPVWRKGDPMPERGVNFLLERKEGDVTNYYWNNYRIYNARDLSTINNLDFSTNKEGKVTVSDKEVDYTNWIKDNFYTNSVPNDESKLVSLNGYFNYTFPIDQEKITKPKEKSLAERIAILQTDLERARLSEPDAVEGIKNQLDTLRQQEKTAETIPKADSTVLGKDTTLPDKTRNQKWDAVEKRLKGKKFKTAYQKQTDIDATKEQIDRARSWYKSHPLSKYVSFNELFNIINTTNPNAVAHWTVHGVTLFKGADYSDLYHEAWHGFTQLFLTKAEKDKMYREARKAEGSFTDFKGKRVKFKNASELQLEEFFAEDFRKFMLTGKKTVAPARKSIFQKLWNILKALFNKFTVEEVARDKNSLRNIHELYEKLRVGDINEKTFDQNNANFDILFSGIKRVTETGMESMGLSDSKQVVDLMDSLITEVAVDNAQDRSFISEHDYLQDKEGRSLVYEAVLNRILSLRSNNLDQLKFEIDSKGNPQLIEQLTNREKIFSFVVDNFGIPTDPNILDTDTGAISYHFRNTRFLIQNEIDAALEDQILNNAEKGSNYVKDKEAFIRKGNESSLEQQAKPEITTLLRSIFDAPDKRNSLGARLYMRETSVSNILSKTLIGNPDSEVLYNKLVDFAKDPKTDYQDVYKQLVIRLGNPNDGTYRSKAIWKKFQHWVDKVMRPLQQLNVHKSETLGETTVRFGIVSGKGKGVEQKWKNGFITNASPFMHMDQEGQYLDLKDVVEHYGYNVPVNKRIEFLRDIGIGLSIKSDGTEHDKMVDAIEINDNLSRSKYGVDHIYEHIKWLAYTQDSKIRDIKDLYRKRMDKRGWEGRFVNLAKLEADINPIIGHMSSTAKGTMQFELSLHSSNSRVVTGINNSNTVQDVTDPNGMYPYLSYLNPERNFFTRDSIWMASLYDPITGKRISTLDTFNASGVSLIDANGNFLSGTALADADFIDKIIGDIYTFSQGYIAEGTRTSDRGSTYLQHPNKIANPGVYLDESLHIHSGKHYIDPPYFLVRGGETESKGRKFTKRILFLKLKNELDRINYFKDPNLPQFEKDKITASGKKYSEVGQEFVMFHNVLRDTTKEALKAVNTDENLYNYLRDTNSQLLARIESDMDIYLDSLRDSLVNRIGTTQYPVVKLVESFTQIDSSGKTPLERYSVRAPEEKAYSERDFEEALIDSFISNQWIHNAEEQAFFYGDLALYKGAMDYVKRITGGPATGGGFLNDNAAIDSVNHDLGKIRPYADSEWYTDSGEPSPKTSEYNGIVQSAVLQDPIFKSIYEAQIKERIRLEEEPTLKASGRYTQEEIDKLLNSMIDNSYGKINPTDGQGYMAFDSYRILSFLSDDGWSDQQEELYMKIVNKEKIDRKDVVLLFPPLKLQMFGALATEGAPVSSFHKFSLLPLIPTLTEGYIIEDLHNKMVSQNVDYILFKSASKSAYLGKNGKTDLYFTDSTHTEQAFAADDYTFSKNPVYVEFLKNQMSVPNKYKKLSTFSSQFRRLITIGLMSDGIPVDFKPDLTTKNRKEKWDALSKEGKSKSTAYNQYLEFNNSVKDLTRLKKAELNFDITDAKGQLNLEKFVRVARNEFGRMGLGKHEQSFLETLENGDLQYTLDMSPSSKMFQGIIMSMLERRLVKQKFPGEGLIQMSSVGFESEIAKPDMTQDEKFKEGTNGLSFYHFDKDNNYQGWVDVRISLQADFEKLLRAIHTDGKPVRTLDRLNELIKNPKWLADKNNVRMITFLSPRIPGQTKASYDVCRVKHFFPKESGPIIQGPPEWLAKKGIDFDIDKEFTLFPRITLNAKKEPVIAAFSETDIKKLWKQLRGALQRGVSLDADGNLQFADAEVDNIIVAMFGEAAEGIVDKVNLLSLKEFTNKMKMYSAENRVLSSIESILADPKFYTDLVRPNGTYYFTKLADKLAPYTIEFNTSLNIFGKDFSNPSPTRVFEPEPNLFWHQSFSIGMQDLAIAAVDNASTAMFLEAGFPMRPIASIQQGKETFEIPQVLYLPHNETDYHGKPAISISSLRNVEGFKMNEYSAQLITILVDIVKNPETMAKLGINRFNFPIFSYLIARTGVPVETAAYFINNPFVREYIRTKATVKSKFANTLGIDLENPAFFESKARDIVLQKRGILGGREIYNFNKKRFYEFTTEEMAKRDKPEFSEKELWDRLVVYTTTTKKGQIFHPNRLDQLVLLHYMEIEDQNRSLTNLKLGLRFDIARSKDVFTTHSRKLNLEMAKIDGRFAPEILDEVMEKSFIGEFDLQEFVDNNIVPLFPLSEHKSVNKFLMTLMSDKKDFRNYMQTVGAETPKDLANGFKTDLPSFVYQNLLRGFNTSNIKTYKGLSVERKAAPKSAVYDATGVYADNKTLYIDIDKVRESFKLYSEGRKNSEATVLRLQYPKPVALISFDEFAHFVTEREYLRTFRKPADMLTNPYYIEALTYVKENIAKVSIEDAEKIAYENALKNMALDNIFNPWKLFESDTAYALEYGKLVSEFKKDYPAVIDAYPVLQHIVPSPLGPVNNPAMWNLKQQTAILTQTDRELFHENLQMLANPAVVKTPDDVQKNDRISEFFRRLPFIAMLQSFNTDTEFGLGRIIPKEDYLAFLDAGFKKFVGILDRVEKNNLEPEILKMAFDKYIDNNRVNQYRYALRQKNYLLSAENIERFRMSQRKEELLAAPAVGDLYILPESAYDTIVLAQSNPDTIFAYNGKTGNPSASAANVRSSDGMFGQKEITNSVGLALYDSYVKPGVITDATLEDNMKAIDEFVKTLKERRDDPINPKTILFNPNGYGQAMIGASPKTGANLDLKRATAPETFYYLSRQLRDNFGYTNKNFIEAEDMIKKVELMEQNINDLAREKIIKCFK